MSADVVHDPWTPFWYIDALDAAAGRAFITKRVEEESLAESVLPPVFVAPPYFLAEPVASAATALGAARQGFQVGVFAQNDRQLAFMTLEDAIDFVRRLYARVGGTGRDGGGEARFEPRPDIGGEGAGETIAFPQPQWFDAVLHAIADFTLIANAPDQDRKELRYPWSWRPVISYVDPAHWDELLDWGLARLWSHINSLQTRLPGDQADALTQRYNEAVMALGHRFHAHLKAFPPYLSWTVTNSSTIDRFDLLAALPAPIVMPLAESPPISLAEMLALSVASPVFVGASVETLALVLLAASILAHLPTVSADGYLGNSNPAVFIAGLSGGLWLADNWPRVVQSAAAEELLVNLTVTGSAVAYTIP